MTNSRFLLLVSLALSAGFGCRDATHVPVRGEVTFAGVPVEQGSISFIALEPPLRSEGAPIVDGKFDARITPGSKRVEIRGSRLRAQSPQADPSLPSNLREDFIPPRYHASSELTADISPEGENQLTFKLTP